MTAYGPDGDYDPTLQEATLRLIIRRCGQLAGEAAVALRVPAPAARQARLDRLIPRALSDPEAAWTKEEREELADAMWAAGPDDTAHPPERRTERLIIRITPSEHEQLKREAAAAGLTVSELVRIRTLGS